LALLAGFGLAALREELRATSGSWSAKLIDVAMVCGAAWVAATFPSYDAARVQDMAEAGATWGGTLPWLTTVSLAAALAWAWLRSKAGVSLPSK
jgi:hypothetical protein